MICPNCKRDTFQPLGERDKFGSIAGFCETCNIHISVHTPQFDEDGIAVTQVGEASWVIDCEFEDDF